ncbi:MAG: DinB family protein [Actinomycetota bacterium]
MPDHTVTALRDVLAESLAEIHDALVGLSMDELNARPGGEGTNPMAVIAVHTLASTRSWISLAFGEPLPPRDRPSEFTTVAGDGFIRDIDDAIAAVLALVGGQSAFDPAREGVATWVAHRPDEPVTAAWALQHCLAHVGEHVGHAHLTRQLLRP